MLGSAVAGLLVLRRHLARRLAARRPAAPPTVRAADGVELHVEVDEQPGTAVTVVLVHGYAAALQEWQQQRAALRRHARVVLYDQRGHGRSGWGPHRHATAEQLGSDLGRVLDQRAGDGPVVLVAHSMGGVAVLALAAQRPELFGRQVVGVALLSTSLGKLLRTGAPPPLGRLITRTRALAPWLWLVWLLAPALELVAPRLIRRSGGLLRRRLFGAPPVAPATVELMQSLFTSTPLPVAAAFLPVLARHDQGPAVQAFAGLPVLALTGDQDAVVPAEHSSRIAWAVGSSCRLLVVPGAGHMVNLTHPAVVTAELLRLLRAATGHDG